MCTDRGSLGNLNVPLSGLCHCTASCTACQTESSAQQITPCGSGRRKEPPAERCHYPSPLHRCQAWVERHHPPPTPKTPSITPHFSFSARIKPAHESNACGVCMLVLLRYTHNTSAYDWFRHGNWYALTNQQRKREEGMQNGPCHI